MDGDDFVRSILGDDAPLVSPARGKKGRQGGNGGPLGRGGAWDESVVSYGTPTESSRHPATDDGSHALHPTLHTGGVHNGRLSDVSYSLTRPGVDIREEDLPFDIRFQREKMAASVQQDDDTALDRDDLDEALLFGEDGGLRTHKLFRYVLLFINFTFVVAALLMIMAGVVAGFNSALQLCSECGRITVASIVLGGIQWLLGLFAFNWIRQRNILFLLGYVASVLAITVALFTIFIAGIAYSVKLTGGNQATNLLRTWEADINRTDAATGELTLCTLQLQYNCTGFHYGCCNDGCTNVTAAPANWKTLVCPNCKSTPKSDTVCTNDVTASAVQNLGGFVVITFLAIVLTVTGILLAAFSRTMNR